MSRVRLTEAVFEDRSGYLSGVDGASVQVNAHHAGAATVYDDETGTGVLANPLTTRNGRIEPVNDPGGDVWLDTGSYDLIVTPSDGPQYASTFEAVNGSAGGTPGPAGPAGPTGPAGPSGVTTLTFRASRGYAIGGALDSTIVVPDTHVSLAATQTGKLVALIARIEGGTSIDVQLRRNGSNVGAAQTVTPAKQAFTYTQVLTDGDALDLTLANPVGLPTDLGATLVIEHVVT